MKFTNEKAALAAGMACVGACAVSLGLGGLSVGMTAGGIAALLTGEGGAGCGARFGGCDGLGLAAPLSGGGLWLRARERLRG